MKNESVVMSAPGEIKIAEAPMPVCGPGEALLELLYGGLCGSDLGAYRGTYAYAQYPNVPGHEFSARIVEVADNPQGLKAGDVVIGNPYFNCGVCYSCRRGLVNCCVNNQTMGVQREGAYSRFITMPVERLYPVDGLDPKLAALVEPFAIGYHGVQQAMLSEGDRVLVVGAGTIGIFTMLAAKQKGARVYITDVAPQKLEFAEKMGADGVLLNDSPAHFAEQAQSITQGDGFDAALEAVGTPETLQLCLDSAAHGGHVVLIGISKRHLDLDSNIIQKKELMLRGSRNAGRQDFLDLIAWMKEHGAEAERMITDLYPFEQAAAAFQAFSENAASKLKVMLAF
ncbi:MAG: zinc-binding alcohol dehydrogenase family protein [Eubacteriales bacterium]|nr:zinc-binding alcohol dehydrogenase family protein [Eubacteriales bacterium]